MNFIFVMKECVITREIDELRKTTDKISIHNLLRKVITNCKKFANSIKH